MSNNPYTWIAESLDTIQKANWYRFVHEIDSIPGAIVLLEGQKLINFASNDYLGLAGDDRLIQAAIKAAERWGTGSTGSRLLSGHKTIHKELETAIASLKRTEDALVFSSGYLANLGAIAAILNSRDLVLSDQYNHSSLKNGANLSNATVINYLHSNMENLTLKLEQNREKYRRCLIITDSVFSMDGDLCQLIELLNIAEKYNSMLLIDEAHATGVLGKNGAGCVEHFHCTGKQLIQIGTLSKALGSLGGYVAGDYMLIDFLRNRAPSWIYTTALSPPDTAAALAAVNIIQAEPQRRQKLWENVIYLKKLIAQELPNLKLLPSESPIICIQLENAAMALQVGKLLKAKGIFAPAIRPPTVPTSRIRISVMATHEMEHIHKLVEVLQDIFLKGNKA